MISLVGLEINIDGTLKNGTSYYPSGMEWNGSEDIQFAYNGKEKLEMHGFNMYDYGARYYDMRLSRWHSMDPLAEMYYSTSPYAYCLNNPVMLIDPDGRNSDWFENRETGDVYYNSEYRKGDEQKIGENWVHKGENGMYMKEGDRKLTPEQHDGMVIRSNQKLAENINFTSGRYSLGTEALFKGDNAVAFMGNMGYEKKPHVADVYTYTSSQGIPDSNGINYINQKYQSIINVESWTYAPKGSVADQIMLQRLFRPNEYRNISNFYSRETIDHIRFDYRMINHHDSDFSIIGPLFFEIMKVIINK